jgi:hypothetical protein
VIFFYKSSGFREEYAMSSMDSGHLLAGALILAASLTAASPAMAECDDLVGKQITLHGRIISADPLLLGGTGQDEVIIQSSEPSCGKIQMSLKIRSCQTGNSELPPVAAAAPGRTPPTMHSTPTTGPAPAVKGVLATSQAVRVRWEIRAAFAKSLFYGHGKSDRRAKRI